MKWSKKTPAKDGSYWIRYRGTRGMVECHCNLMHIGRGVVVKTSRNDIFVKGGRRRAPGISKMSQNVRFGDRINEPELLVWASRPSLVL